MGQGRQQGDNSALAQGGQQQQQQQDQQQQSNMLNCNGTSEPGGSSSSGDGGTGDASRVQLSFHEAADGSPLVRLQAGGGAQHSTREQLPQPAAPRSPLPAPHHQQLTEQPQQQQQPEQQSTPLQHLQQQQQQAQAQAGAQWEQPCEEIVAALMSLLASDLLPPLSLWTLGWLLSQLLCVGKGGALLTPPQRQTLAAAVARQQAALQQQLQGCWCDALVPMVAAEWGRCRQAILRTGPGSVHVAVQTWMQVRLAARLPHCCCCL